MTNPVTRHPSLVTVLLFAGMALLAGCGKSGDNAAGNAPTTRDPSHGSGFSTVEYFPPPNQTQVRSRLTGTDAQPSGDLVFLKQPKLELFTTNGAPQAIIEAPECVYDMQNKTVDSASHLRMQTGDGKLRVEGDGFLWRQDDSFLTISNHVHTVIESSPKTKALL